MILIIKQPGNIQSFKTHEDNLSRYLPSYRSALKGNTMPSQNLILEVIMNEGIATDLNKDQKFDIDDATTECEFVTHNNPPNSQIEWVDMLNNQGNVIGSMTRSAMRIHKLLHKATYLIVHDINNQILIQKRTLIKDYYPGYLDAAAGGVVQSDEDWMLSIKREAFEELGIIDLPFIDHGEFEYQDDKGYILGRLYSCITTGPFALQASEVEEVHWMSVETIMARANEFTPDSLFALSKWLHRNT